MVDEIANRSLSFQTEASISFILMSVRLRSGTVSIMSPRASWKLRPYKQKMGMSVEQRRGQACVYAFRFE